MKKLLRLTLSLALIPYLSLNSCCFAKNAKKVDTINHSKKSKSESSKNQVNPIQFTVKKSKDNKTTVNVVMYIPHKKKQKSNAEKVELSNLNGGKISGLRKKVSTVNIDGKSYMKIEFEYVVEIRDKTDKDFVWPVPGFNNITSDFYDKDGREHCHGAIDISSEGIYGSDVVAAGSGKVIVANTEGWGGGYGKHVVIDHGNGKTTLYGHMSNVDVKVDQKVSSGQKIGSVGNTGYSTGPHLHFEYRIDGIKTDPAEILDI